MDKKKAIVVALIVVFLIAVGVVIFIAVHKGKKEEQKSGEPKTEVLLKEINDVKEFFDPKLMDKDVKKLSDKEAKEYIPEEVDDGMGESHGCLPSYRLYSYKDYVIELIIGGCYSGTEINIIKDGTVEKNVIRAFSVAYDEEKDDGTDSYPILKDGKLYYLLEEKDDSKLGLYYLDFNNDLKDVFVEKTKFVSPE